MKKITDKIKLFIGVLALCLLFSFNLIHALNDYGVSNPNNQLHPQVYAQTNTAGNGGGSTPGSNPGGGTPGEGTPGEGTPPPNLVQFRVPGSGYAREYIYNWRNERTGYQYRRQECCVWTGHYAAWCDHDKLPLCRRDN